MTTYSPIRQQRIAQHLCILCGTPLPPSTSMLFCSDCAEKRGKYGHTIRAKRREQGLCLYCDSPALEGKTKCLAHLQRDRGYQQNLRERRIATGLCSHCGKFPILAAFIDNAAYRPCEKCYLQKLSRMRLGKIRHWPILRQKLVQQEYKCAYTGTPLTLGVNDSLDHIYPSSRYPELANDPENLEWVTREINEMKRDRTPDEFLSLIRTVLQYRTS